MSLYFEDNFPGWSNGVNFRKPVQAPVIDTGGQVFNVKSNSYGATGSGVINDTVAIQSALTAASNAGGGIVYMPPGTYLVSPTGLNVGSNTIFRGAGASSIIKVPNGANVTGNIVKAQNVSNVWYDSFAIDGNGSNQSSGTNFGSYFGAVTNGAVTNLFVKNMTGDGIHVYNSTGIKVLNNWSTGNAYHGFECEQNIACTWQGNRAYSNTLHGIIINPGEVGGTGSQSISLIGNICDGNSQYGVAVGVANGDISQHLSTDCVIANNIIRNNSQYGVQIYQQSGFLVTGNEITGNGYFGIYVYQSRYNQIVSNRLHNNSQASNGSYDEIFLEGNSGGYASTNNVIADNSILIDGTTKARYAINEGSSSDGPNIITNNNIPNAGTSGTINQLVPSDVVSSPGGVVQIGDNGQAIQGSNAGFDSAFSHVLRLYNNFTSGSTQVVTPNGNVQFYVGGSNVLNVNSSDISLALGSKLKIGTGSNASAGVGTLSGGTVTISTTAVTASSLIFLTDTNSSLTNVGNLSVTAKSAGTSFTVTSSNALDTSTFNWLIVN